MLRILLSHRSLRLPGKGVGMNKVMVAWCLVLCWGSLAADESLENKPGNGYRGIWYQISGAYSGGMATYPQHQMPLAVYAPAVQTTFFVYGGQPESGANNLQMMIGAFNHKTKMLANPTLVRDCKTNDAHANPCMAIDAQGYIFIYCAARGGFPGRIYRSSKPYAIDTFDMIVQAYMPYPQAWIGEDGRHFLKFTKYERGGRCIYSTVSKDGLQWSLQETKNRRKSKTKESATLIAGNGHYVATYLHKGRLWMALNWHRGGSDSRTNLYVILSDDFGETWKTIDGNPISLPMVFPGAPGLVHDYAAENKYIYLNDVIVDEDGNPIILYVQSSGGSKSKGKKGEPRNWMTARHDGKQWHRHPICPIDHNYDYGNIRIDDKGTWRVVGPTEPGPRPDTTGGDIAMWESTNQGVTWKKVKVLTENSTRNHSYVRIPFNYQPEFFAFWADGNTKKRSESDLYFSDWDGTVFRMPRKITGEWARPIAVK